MPRVLLPSDHRDWVVNFAAGYTRLGWDVTTGAYNFDLEACQPDVVHFNWPEELTGWKVPDAARVDVTIKRLDRWAKRSRIIVSVNNLYPHGQHGQPVWHRLYSAFYERADVIHHFSQVSKDMVCAEYPTSAGRNHVVRLGFNYDTLLPGGLRDRGRSRAAFGITPAETVYLVFGTLRFWSEVCLLRDAFKRATVPSKRLLLAARYTGGDTALRSRWRRWRWRRWQASPDLFCVPGYVPDEDVYKLYDAADVVLVIRQDSMGSGLPCLAMTLGRMVIGPNYGAVPEYLGGADNLLYDTTSAASLALAMERAALADREAVGARNREIAAGWTWEGIIVACLDALPPARS